MYMCIYVYVEQVEYLFIYIQIMYKNLRLYGGITDRIILGNTLSTEGMLPEMGKVHGDDTGA